jgi:hypothetical protein
MPLIGDFFVALMLSVCSVGSHRRHDTGCTNTTNANEIPAGCFGVHSEFLLIECFV